MSNRKNWCPEQDLNLHALRHTVLSRARLPIPPSGRTFIVPRQAAAASRTPLWPPFRIGRSDSASEIAGRGTTVPPGVGSGVPP
jgi:hypothetical protein